MAERDGEKRVREGGRDEEKCEEGGGGGRGRKK